MHCIIQAGMAAIRREVCRWLRAGVTARPGPAGPMCDCLTPTTEARASAGAPASPGGTRGPATDARPSGFAYPPAPMPPLQSNKPGSCRQPEVRRS